MKNKLRLKWNKIVGVTVTRKNDEIKVTGKRMAKGRKVERV